MCVGGFLFLVSILLILSIRPVEVRSVPFGTSVHLTDEFVWAVEFSF